MNNFRGWEAVGKSNGLAQEWRESKKTEKYRSEKNVKVGEYIEKRNSLPNEGDKREKKCNKKLWNVR